MADAKEPDRSGVNGRSRRTLFSLGMAACWVASVLVVAHGMAQWGDGAVAAGAEATPVHVADSSPGFLARFNESFSSGRLMVSLLLLACSAFFSATEVAFFSLHKLRVRAMRESDHYLSRRAAQLLDHPGNLLTTILMGNNIVNVLLTIVLAPKLEELFAASLGLPSAASYLVAGIISMAILVLFGEITPKVIAVLRNESFACFAALPIAGVDWLLAPLRNAMLGLVGFLFRVTRFSQVRPAPFMTDEEFKSLLSDGQAVGVIEEDERRMIEGVLEAGDIVVREILIPRPDVVALPEQATIADALVVLREQEYARVPVYEDNLDHITGVLYVKDLLQSVAMGKTDQPIRPLLRKPLFVPETMNAADFIKTAQRMHMHLAIVVDEFGGTEGLVTLHDALREVVGDIGDEVLEETPPYEVVGEGVYRVEGNLPLDELQDLTGVPVEDEEHTTVAGFLMDLSEKVLDAGDRVVHEGIEYTVEAMEKKRVARILIRVPQPKEEEVHES